MTEISLANLAKGLNLTFKVRLGLSMAHNPRAPRMFQLDSVGSPCWTYPSA